MSDTANSKALRDLLDTKLLTSLNNECVGWRQVFYSTFPLTNDILIRKATVSFALLWSFIGGAYNYNVYDASTIIGRNMVGGVQLSFIFPKIYHL